MFQPKPEDHEKYGGDPQNPHKLHIVTRIRSTKRRPYWEKDTIKMLGLQKAHSPQIHKNILSVNAKLKEVKPLIHVQPLKLPQGLPTEQTMPQGHWGVGRAVASEAYGAGSEVLTPHSFSSQMH